MIIEPEKAELIIKILDDLSQVNRFVPIIVEGKRDREALRRLGIEGRIIQLHSGKNIYEFCEDILRSYEHIILLLDWDERGELLYKKVTSYLKGHFEEFSIFRETIKSLCESVIKEVEEIPRLLKESLGGLDMLINNKL